jgi:formate/nitrite transporter FocA (FNT family)
MTNKRGERRWSATAMGTLLGAAGAAVILLLAAALLTREPGSALKSIIAVWLVALPVLGLGTLCGWLLATALAVALRGKAVGGRGR